MSVVENTSVKNYPKTEKQARKNNFISKLFKFGKNKTKSSIKETKTPHLDSYDSKTPLSLNNHPSISYNHNIDSKAIKSLNFNTEGLIDLSKPIEALKPSNPWIPNGAHKSPVNLLEKRQNHTSSSPTKSLDNAIITSYSSKKSSKSESYKQPTKTSTNINAHIGNNMHVICNKYDENKQNDCHINTNNNNNNIWEQSEITSSTLCSNTNDEVHKTMSQRSFRKFHTPEDSLKIKSNNYFNSILFNYSTSKITGSSDVKTAYVNEGNMKDDGNKDDVTNSFKDICQSIVPYHKSKSDYIIKNEVAIENVAITKMNDDIKDTKYTHKNNYNSMDLHNNEDDCKTYIRIDRVTYNKLLTDLSQLKSQLSQLQLLLN